MSVAAIDARISWDGVIVGGFTIGDSTIGGTDTISSVWAADFGGVYDDLSALVDHAEWSRGRDDLLTSLLAGEASITALDETGLFNPKNPSSPLAGKLLPMRPAYIKYRDGLGVAHGCFRGFVNEIRHDGSSIPARTTFSLIDLFVMLKQTFPVIAATGPTTTGAAIGVVLDALGFTETGLRALAVGDSIPSFSADGSIDALTLISNLLEAERGSFFIDGDGVATYLDRYDRARRVSAGTVAGNARTSDAAASLNRIQNRARVTRTGGAQMTYFDPASVALYGFRDAPEIDTPYLNNDAEALLLAQRIVVQGRDPRSPIRDLELPSQVGSNLTEILTRELGDRITVSPGGLGTTGTEGDFYIEGMSVSTAGGGLLGSWTLSDRSPADAQFVIGTSSLVATGTSPGDAFGV